jgi:pyruvate dehydrogenase E1 component beta subunit
MRTLRFYEAINEAIGLSLANYSSVYLMGLGVPDPKGVFGSTTGLQEKFGSHRVMDMPTAENGMTGVAIGSALVGMRPIITHQRVDFAILAVDQVVNQASKWYYMFGGQVPIPIVIRMVIGRGWGQGPQHSQSLQSWFAHVPGLKVVMPTTPYDAKGLFIASVEDNNPVIFIEHRWLYNTVGHVPEGIYRVPLGQSRVARQGKDLTIAAVSYMVLEALRAAEFLAQSGVEVEVIDIRTLKPLDSQLIVDSVRKTGHLMVADTSWRTAGFAAEVIAGVVEEALGALKSPPRRITLPDSPAPTTPALSSLYYPRAKDVALLAAEMLGIPQEALELPEEDPSIPLDVPDPTFTGPF